MNSHKTYSKNGHEICYGLYNNEHLGFKVKLKYHSLKKGRCDDNLFSLYRNSIIVLTCICTET